MATSTMYFPKGLYPQFYTPPIPGYDYNPSLGELLDLDTATTIAKSTTQQVLQLANGLKAKLIGTGLAYDASGDAVSGTLTAIQILLNDGTTLVQQLTGINRPVQDVADAASAFNAYDFNEWLMSGNDIVNGSTGDDELYGFAGNDVLNGGNGSDYMEGGAGDDAYNGGDGFDVLSFQDAYFDRTALRGINLNATNQTVVDPWGNSETFTSIEGFRGTQFSDVMVGSAVDEEFMGLGGRDTIDGGGGLDTIRFDRDARRGGVDGVTVNLATGVAIDGFGRQDSLRNIENIRATEAADSLVGSSVANRIRAFGGNDSINGGLGADEMRGGAGNDAYAVDNLGDVVNELDDSGSGIDQVFSSIGFNLSSSQTRGVVENLTLTGSAAINGTGNAAANVLTGNAAANVIAGMAGNDRLIGGLGLDTLTGGSEVDTFVFATTADSGIGASLADRIADHVSGEKIDVSLIDANAVAAGNQAFVLDLNASFSIGEIRQTKSGANLLLDFNTDADAAAEMSILLLNHGAVTASDFVF